MPLGTAVRADSTVTFVGLKTGLFLGEGPERAGGIFFDDLEVPIPDIPQFGPRLQRLTENCVVQALPRRARQAHKGDFGRVLIIGGGIGMPGAGAPVRRGVPARRRRSGDGGYGAGEPHRNRRRPARADLPALAQRGGPGACSGARGRHRHRAGTGSQWPGRRSWCGSRSKATSHWSWTPTRSTSLPSPANANGQLDSDTAPGRGGAPARRRNRRGAGRSPGGAGGAGERLRRYDRAQGCGYPRRAARQGARTVRARQSGHGQCGYGRCPDGGDCGCARAMRGAVARDPRGRDGARARR